MFCANVVGTGGAAAGGHAEFMPGAGRRDDVAARRARLRAGGADLLRRLHGVERLPLGRPAAARARGRWSASAGSDTWPCSTRRPAGFETIAVSHSPDKDKFVRELGADEVVRDGKGLAAAGGVDVVLATGNSVDAMADAIAGLRPDGRLVLMGFEAKPLPVSPGDLIMRRLKIVGSQQNGREYLFEALDYAAKGKVKVVAETFSLNEINRAYDRVAEGKVRFRAVIVN
jgi:alcohol dehydrogenase